MNTTSPKNTELQQKATAEKAELIKLSLDVHADSYVVVRQVDNQLFQPPQTMVPDFFMGWVVKQKELAKRVVVCYETGPFGFVLARDLIKQGIECIVMAAQKLDERGKRVQTDRLDALAIAGRLDRYLAGNTKALSVVRIPTVEEQQQRSEARQRNQLQKTRRQLEAQGRSLLVFNGYPQASSQWWRDALWEDGQKLWPAEVVQMLARWREVLVPIETQLCKLQQKLEESLNQHLPQTMSQLPIALGAWTWVALCREVSNWDRFSNRKQVGSFTGLVASEFSTGKSKRQGPITKVGNPRIRMLMVELIYRFIRYQPDYRVIQKWMPRYNATRSRSQRKKIIVAMARECSVDMWRLATGQTTLEKLGLRVQTENKQAR